MAIHTLDTAYGILPTGIRSYCSFHAVTLILGETLECPNPGLDRRELVTSALASPIASALAATFPTGRTGNMLGMTSLLRTMSGAPPPRYHPILPFDYQNGGEPTAENHREVEGALHQLERAFEWRNEGLLFTIGYAPTYNANSRKSSIFLEAGYGAATARAPRRPRIWWFHPSPTDSRKVPSSVTA